jgi:hypothetical protein
VITWVSRNFLNGMLASITADVQAAGDIEGGVTHFRLDNAVSSLSPFNYGLFTYNYVDGSFLFGGVGAATALYYYYEWELEADATGLGFGVAYGIGADGIQVSDTESDARGLVRSGNRSGSVVGQSMLLPRLSLDLFSPALATFAGTQGDASMDFWITFSTQPINGLPKPGGGSVPEPPAWALALTALSLLWRSRRLAR